MDKKLLKNFDLIGTDEVGRGPICGPVTACAVRINHGNLSFIDRLKALQVTDSKKLTTKKRKTILESLGIELSSLASERIYHQENFSFKIVSFSSELIDEINILKASLLAMKEASDALLSENTCLLIDGNKVFDSNAKKREAVIKGDLKSFTIGLASIIAKEFRDELMIKYSLLYTGLDLENNKGYPTKKHLEGLEKFGITPIHRKSYAPVRKIIEGGEA